MTIITLTALAAGVFLFFIKDKEYESSIVQRGTISRSVKTDAVVVKGAEYDLSFIEDGKIDSVFVWVGKNVKKGDLLISLHNSTERKNYNNALDILKSAEDRYKKILNTEVPDNIKEQKDHEDELDLALADVVAAQVLVESTRALVERTRVRAPIDGVITKVSGIVGQDVTENNSVITISDKQGLYMEADVSIYDGIFITREQRVYAGDRDPVQSSVTGLKYEGERLLVSILLPSDKLELESVHPIRIVTAESRDTLFVPRDSLYETETGYYVKRLVNEEKMETERVEVSIGLTGDGDLVEIKNGLLEGDKIIWEKVTE